MNPPINTIGFGKIYTRCRKLSKFTSRQSQAACCKLFKFDQKRQSFAMLRQISYRQTSLKPACPHLKFDQMPKQIWSNLNANLAQQPFCALAYTLAVASSADFFFGCFHHGADTCALAKNGDDCFYLSLQLVCA